MGEEAMQKKVVNGCFENLPELESTVVRVFFSSTFTDMTVDRNYLMRNSVSRIREHCLKRGLDFQIVDFRWGVRDEASIDHSTNDIVEEEVASCKKLSRGPYFVLFLGDKYGFRSLPREIEANEYKILFRTAMKLGCDTFLMSQWYKKDDNAEPAVFYFLPITDVLPNYDNDDPQKSALKEKDRKEWATVEEKLTQYFRKAADEAYEENRITKDQRQKYFYSVTEAEATAGILNSDCIRNRVLAYFRTFEDLKVTDEKAVRFTDLLKDTNTIDQEAKELRERLKIAKIQPKLIPDEMKKDILYWTPEGVDPDDKDHAEYLMNLDKHFEERMLKMIDFTFKKKQGNTAEELMYEEILQHLHFVERKLECFSGREEVLEEIRDKMCTVHGYQEDEVSTTKDNDNSTEQSHDMDGEENVDELKDMFDLETPVSREEDPYFQEVKDKKLIYKEKGIIYAHGDMDQDIDNDPEKNLKLELIKKCHLKEYCHPVILHGESGSGKTSLMAKVAELSKTWFPGCSTIVRFLGTSVDSASLRDVLGGLIKQICKVCNRTLPSSIDLGGDFLYLTQFFEALLNNYKSPQTLVIILDSVDQLTHHDRAYLMNWVPLRLPTNVHLVVSTLQKTNGCLQNIRNRLIFEQQYIEVPVLPIDTSDIVITKICQTVGRRVTKSQRRHLLEMFSKCGKPLYVKLLTDMATLWRSTRDVSEFKVEPNIQAAVNLFFDELERKNGKVVVEKTFGFLSASREGMSHAEIEDLLSIDDESLQDTYLYHLPPDPDNIRIPSSVLSLLVKDIKDYMVMQKSGGKKVVKWYHRQFTEVAKKRYLKSKEQTICIHQLLVEYFRGTWYDKAKPLELYKKKKASYTTSKRGVPDQPLYFDSIQCNVRKLIELPLHLIRCKLFKDFRDEMACRFEWLYAKCKYVSVSSLVEDMKMALAEMDAAGDIDDVETYNDIKTVEQLLSLGFENIRKDSSHLALQILGQLGVEYNRSPSLRKMVNETKEWAESSDISLLLPTAQCLPSPDGYMKCLISAQVGAYDQKSREHYGHVMHLQENNNVLIVLEKQKDNKNDYVSIFDMNDNGSAAFSEKIDKRGTISLTCVNDRFTILTHKGSEGFDGSSLSDQLLNTETFLPINLPNIPDCITVSDKFVVYSAITQINICTIGENTAALSVIHSIQMEDKVAYLIISPDNKYLVAFLDKSLSVFSLENFEKLHTVKSESESFYSGSTPYRSLVHILKNNRLIYQGFGYKDNKKMYVVDLESGKNLYHVSHYKEYSSTVVSVHPSERVVAFGTGSTGTVNGDCDKRWYIHQADDGKQISECTTEFSGKYGVTCLCLFGSDKIFAASALMFNEKNDIKIFYAGTVDHPLTTVVPCQSLTGHSQEIVQLLFNKDENILYTASKDCTIRVWNVGRVVTEFNDKYLHSDKQFDETKTLEDYRTGMKTSTTDAIKIGSDDKTVLLGMSDGQFVVRDLLNRTIIHEQNVGRSITHLLTSRSGKEIIVVPRKDDVLVINSQTYDVTRKLHVPFLVNCAAEANDILVVGCGGMEAKGIAFNIKDGTMIKEFQLLYSLRQVAINSTGTKIVSTMFDFPLVYSLTNEDETDSMQNMSFNDTMMSGSSAVSISPDDKYAFSASTDGGIRIVEMSGKYIMRFDQKSSAVAALFSPDSKYIVSCGFKTIYVWCLAEGVLSCKLKKHDDFVVDLKFDNTGKYLLTSSRDKRLVLWDFHRGISLAMFVAHCQVQVVDLSSDARYAVFIPDDIADISILRLNKMLTNIIEGKHRLQITPALLGAQAMALSFSSQKMRQKETSGIGCQVM